MTEEANSVEAIATLARKGDFKQLDLPGGDARLIHDKEMQVHKLVEEKDIYRPAPPRIRQAVSIDAKDSFVNYVNAYKGTNNTVQQTRIFADVNAGKFVAVLDYHATPDKAAVCEHRATFTLVVSEEWKRWTELDGKKYDQFKFVRYLEENMADIEDPPGADIMELARDFSAHRKASFQGAVRTQTGDYSFEYVEETTASSKSGAITVPNMFKLRVPIWFGEQPIEQFAFLRFDTKEGLALGIELHRHVFVKQAAFQLLGHEIADRTGCPVHYGKVG